MSDQVLSHVRVVEGLRAETRRVLMTVGLFLMLAATWLNLQRLGSPLPVIAVHLTVSLVVMSRIEGSHPFPRFGTANLITLTRAALIGLIGSLALNPAPGGGLPFAIFFLAILALVLDGIDGWAARRTGLASRFGARFDMEVDALAIMMLSLIAYSYGKAGLWVLGLGLMRYAFVAAGLVLPALKKDLPPSRRRKAVCVLQLAILTALTLPFFAPPWSELLSFVALVALAWSFATDTRWLLARPLSQ